MKKYYNEPQNSVISGVCSGIATYVNIDPIFVRVVFVVFFSAMIVPYLVFALCAEDKPND